MKKRIGKLFAFVLTLAMVLTSVTWPDAVKASAAVTPEEGLTEKSILTVTGDDLISNAGTHADTGDYNGYLQTVKVSDATGKYFKVTYKTDESVNTDTKVFTFQPYDNVNYDGWNDNFITPGDSQYDDSTGEYVAYIAIDTIKASYAPTNSDGGSVYGINLSFVSASPTITLTGYYMLSEVTQEMTEEEAVTITGDMGDGNGHETLQAISAQDIIDGYGSGITLSEITTNNATVYVHITKCSRYSRLKISGGNVVNVESLSSSNKELIGTKCTTSTNTAYILHAGYRTSGGVGSGQGVAGSGNYVFPANGMSKGTSAETAGVLLRRMTTDVEGYIIGIVFAGGKSVSVAEDGTITKDFDPSSITLESQTADDSDFTDEEWEEANKEAIEKAEKERVAMRDGLKSAIDACKAMTTDDYKQDSIDAVNAALPAAEAAYAKEDDTRENYRAARDALEKVRTAAVPKMTNDAGNPKDFRILSKSEVINEMGAGINLGNTLDGVSSWLTPDETGWQAYKTTKEYIKALHDAGYNTVRVPVTWGSMINDDYSINETWISRVQEIVDYCTDQDMYCIINIHHDGAANHDNRGNNTPGSWLDTYADDIEGVYAKFAGTWKTIANRFKDYDEHLIFESMNEVTDAHDGTANEDTEILNNLNQIFVNTVRATGSNNTKRWLAFTGRFATFSTGTTMPDDPLASSDAETTRLMFSVHIYKDNSSVRWTRSQLVTWSSSLSSTVSNVKALDSNIPIYVGEYGVRQQAQSGSETGYNNAERALNSEFCNAAARFYGACPIVWDQGLTDYSSIKTDTGNFVYWDRPNMEPVYADVIEGMIRGTYSDYDYYKSLDTDESYVLADLIDPIYKSYGHSSTSDNSVSKDPTVTEITDITLDEDTVSLKAGERTTLTVGVTPEVNNDVVLWSTDDDGVATVSQGMIHAKRAGITTVHVYSQSGSVNKDIKVIVSPNGKETATEISTEKAYYTVAQGETVSINTTLAPADSTDEVTYVSSDTSVATVSSSGVVTGVSPGSTYVIITAASGVSTIVKIEVPRSDSNSTVNVALRAYYNSGEVIGTPVTINGDGQYTVSIDLSKDLTDANKTAGIAALQDMVSIYIKDENASKPTVEAAQIRYDKVEVDGTELTLKSAQELYDMWTGNKVSAEIDGDSCFKSAIKANGQFDTNDPINGWDGSVVSDDEITVSSNTVSFKKVTNPQKISVTFTIKGLKFFKTSEKENEATAMTTSDENIIKLSNTGDTKDITLSLTPATTDSFVTVYSTNASVVAVDSTAKVVDENGNVKVTLTAVGEGTAIIVAITENDLKVLYSVGVGDVEVSEPTDPTPPGLDGKDPTPTPSPGTDSTPTPGSTSTPTPAPPSGNGSQNGTSSTSLKVNKTSVIIAAGKSASVGFTSSATPTVKTSNNKVATAKVSGSKIKITVPKKATKGATAKITVKVGSKTATIKVTVKNPAKKIKAVKKTVTVKKKKKVTAKFKITATNKKKAAADTIKVTSKKKKVAKVVKYSIKKGKATVTIKGVKKGKTTVTLKIGKKTAKVTVKVK